MRASLPLLALLLAPGTIAAQPSRPNLTPLGDPGALVEADSALAHRARDKGANAALAAMADDTAEIIVPVRRAARDWLRTRDAAAWFADRQTTLVWASCDGTAGVSSGTWRGGWFVTVWKRRRKLDFRWVLADAAVQAARPPAPDWITGKVADCPPRPRPGEAPRAPGPRPLPAALPDAPAGADSRDGRSDDGSLVWRSTVLPDGVRSLRVWIWLDGALRAVIDRTTPAGG